jgi:subtilisin family serine protease
VAVLGDGVQGLSINAFATNSPTIQGHPNATGAAAVGAAFYFDTPACGTMPATLEAFSSAGGDPILFDVNGNRLATPVVRQKPNFVGPDGVNDTFLGGTLEQYGLPSDTLTTGTSQCQTDATYPSFFGTSAATPHAAGIAALMLQANPAATPAQIFGALQSGALPMSGTSPNYNSGYGFIQATTALAALPPGAPSLSLSSSAINVGQSATLTWSSINTTGCTASGSWSGSEPTSGSTTVTPSTAGSDSYTLTCSNAAGSSSATTDVVTVTAAASSGGHGGGGLDLTTLLALAATLGWRWRISAVAFRSPRRGRSDSTP